METKGRTSKESSDVHMGWLSITIRNRWSDFSSHGMLELGDGSKIQTDFITVAYLRLEMAVSHFGHDLGCKDVPLSIFSNLREGFGGGLLQDEWARIIQNL